jgi:hypothetical protein
VVEWSAKLLTTGGLKLRDCERAAKLARRCMWTGYVPPTNQAKLSDTFTGKVRAAAPATCCGGPRRRSLAAGREAHAGGAQGGPGAVQCRMLIC